MDPLVLNVVNRYRRKVADTAQINVNWVEKMRKDFLTLMKNLPRVRDYDEAVELKKAFDVYRSRFKLLMFDHFLDEYKANGDHRFDHLRAPAWDFYLELSVPLMYTIPPVTKESRFQRFLMDKDPWEKKVKVRAQKFWKAIKDTLENVPESEIKVKTPNRDRLVLEGFQTEIYGFNPQEDWHQESLSKFKESLRIYRRNASKTVPWLIHHQLPIEINFEGKLDEGGEYMGDHIRVSMLSTTGESPLWGAHMMAHEMAHHMYKGLSGSAQEYWDTAIRQDYGPLDLQELLDKWPQRLTWSSDFTDYMSTKDPVLALQVDVLSHGHQSTHAYETREDFQSGFDAGVTTLKVPRNPVTGYAGKKPEEAFCEAIGRLVAYGPATVLDQMKAWLKTVIPGEVKLARTVLAVIRKEKGQYCVRSPNNPDWNGGCYDTKDEAEDRLKQVEFFKHNKSAAIIAYAKSNGIAFSKLKNMSKKELQDLGCGVWDDEGEETLMLFPEEWYDQLPKGLEITTINDEMGKFQPGKSDNDQRFGYLPYGVLIKTAVWKAMVASLEVEVTAERVARLFVAGLADELEKRVEALLHGPYERSKAYDLADWMKQNFKVGVSVRGHRGMADSLDRFMGVLNQFRNEHGWVLSPGADEMTQRSIRSLWERDLKPKIDELIQYFTDEGGSKLVSEYKIGSNTYLNKVGMSEDNLIKYATRLDSLFSGVSGWRKKALSGGLTVALAPPKHFKGTSSGKYSSSDDILYVRAVPKILQRSGGSYGSVDYILIHELGHRYQNLHRLPVDFDKPEWWTSKYSMTESLSGASESFAELFAIGHFNLTGPWEQSKVERFEKLMG